MKHLPFLILFLLNSILCSASIGTKKEIHVLFIGNSLTAINDMPQTLQKMFDERKLNIKVEQLTWPAARLVDFATFVEIKDDLNLDKNKAHLFRAAEKNEVPIAIEKILSKKWDFVVLQEAGTAILIPYFRSYSFEPSVLFLDSVIRSIGGKTILYQDYAFNKYPHHLCEEKNRIEKKISYSRLRQVPDPKVSLCSKNFNNSTDEFLEIKSEYDKLAAKTNAGIVKIGYAFEKFKKQNKHTIGLYKYDGHPSGYGSYLIACLFYKAISGEAVNKVKYDAFIDKKDAALIRKFADTIK